MILKKIMNEIKTINEYLSICKWMDFEFVNISCERIKIIGSIDLSWKNYHSIEIEFEEPEYISALLWGFSLQKDKPFIELEDKSVVSDERGLSLSQDDYCFKINIEDFERSPIRIISKNIKFHILKQPNEGVSVTKN